MICILCDQSSFKDDLLKLNFEWVNAYVHDEVDVIGKPNRSILN